MAGTGKSTIAQSICNRLDADRMLGASFFCSRSAGMGRDDARRIIPTLAFQLAYHIKEYTPELCDVLTRPGRTTQPIDCQLQQLFWDPLDNAFLASGGAWNCKAPVIVVIDGLDECSDDSAQDLVEALLLRFEHNYPIHIRLLLFSRSERHIGIPIDDTAVAVSRFELQNVPRETVNADIRRYVEAGLAEMSRRRRLGYEWYTLDDVDGIVKQADILFVYAATVIKYLSGSKFHPVERLKLVRSLTAERGSGEKALRPLHLLYAVILHNLGDTDGLEESELELVRKILFILSYSPEPVTIPVMSDLVNSDVASVRTCVESLSSIVLVPSVFQEGHKPVKVLHASFPEFVWSSSQVFPTHLKFNAGDMYCLFMTNCLVILRERLRENLRQEQGVFLPNGQMDRTSTLAYAAVYWVKFIAQASFNHSTLKEFAVAAMSQFADAYLLRWLECLLWLGQAAKTVNELRDTDFEVCHFQLPSCVLEDAYVTPL